MTERVQMPIAGGSYLRLEDGSLQLVEGPTETTEAVSEAAPPAPVEPAPTADAPAAVALTTDEEEHI